MRAKNALRLSPAVKFDVNNYWRVAAALYRQSRQRRREREELAAMTEFELKDLSLVPADLRSFVRAPYWRCHPIAVEDEDGSPRRS